MQQRFAVATRVLALLSALTLMAGCSSSAPRAGAERSEASAQGAPMAPACGVPDSHITSITGAASVTHPATGAGRTSIAVAVGNSVTVNVQVDSQAYSLINSGQLVVANPGTSADAFGAAESPSDQLATSVVTSGVAGGQSMTVTWTPTTVGTFPLIQVFHYAHQLDCSTPIPASPATDETFGSEFELATITVR